MNTEKTISLVFKAQDRSGPTLNRIGDRLRSKTRAWEHSLSRLSSKLLRLGTASSAGLTALSGMVLNIRAKTETSLADLSNMGVDNMAMFEKRAREFSNKWAYIEMPDFLKSAEKLKGAYAALDDKNLAAVTEKALIVGRGLKALPEEAAFMYAKFFNIHRKAHDKLSDMQFADLVAGGLSAAYEQFDTDAKRMGIAIATLGAEATNLNIPLQEQIAILGMLTNKLKSPEEAAEAYKGVMANLVKAQKNLNAGLTIGEKKHQFKAHGQPIEFTDKKGNAKSLADVLDTLKLIQARAKKAGLDMAQVNDAIVQSFGSETARKVISNLINDTGELREKTKLVQKSMDLGIDEVMEKAQNRNKGLGERLNLIYKRLKNTGDVVGKSLTPAIKKLDEVTKQYLLPLQTWLNNNQELAGQLIGMGALLSGVVIGVGILSKAFSFLGLAVWANPLTWKIMAIAAVVGSVAYVVYEFYNDWRAAWDKWGDYVIGIAAIVGFAFNPILGIAIAVVGYIINHWSELGVFFDGLWAGIKDRGQRFWWVIQGLGQMAWDGIKAVWSGVAEFFSGLWSGAQDRAQRFWWVVQGAGQLAWDRIKAVWSGFAGFFNELWAEIQYRAQRVWWVIQGAGQMALGYLTGKWAEFCQWLDGLMAGLQEAGGQLWDGISEALEAFIKRAREKWDNLGKLIRSLPDSLREAWDSFWTWLGKKADSVLGPLGSALGGIGDFFGFGDDEKPKAAPKPKPRSGFKQILEKKDSLSRRESEALKRLKAGNSAIILDHRKGTGQAPAPPTVQPTAQPAAQPTEGKLEVIIKAPKGSAQISNLEKRGGDGWNIMAGIEELWAGI
jgi:TP901 family phage tail tape measure protein